MAYNTPRNICCGCLLELPHWGDSNKYPQHMFLGVIKKKQAFYLLPIILLYDGILYDAKFFLKAKS